VRFKRGLKERRARLPTATGRVSLDSQGSSQVRPGTLGDTTIAVRLDNYSHVLPRMGHQTSKAMEDTLARSGCRQTVVKGARYLDWVSLVCYVSPANHCKK
jgi:hypothetical protein